VTFKGSHLFVNLAAPKGELRVEALDEQGKPIEPFTLENSVSARGDGACQRIGWKGASDLSAISGRKVKFRFHLQNGALYAFWVSPNEQGASEGYVAAGGPGFDGPIDTVGRR
jgi:hypothetical protein